MGWRKMEASICVWLGSDGIVREGCSISGSGHPCIYMWSMYLHAEMQDVYPTSVSCFNMSHQFRHTVSIQADQQGQ